MTDKFNIGKISVDGAISSTIYNIYASVILADGEWLYISAPGEPNETGYIYKLRADGTGGYWLTANKTWYMNIDDEWLYFGNSDEDEKLYKMCTDGSYMECLNDEESMFLNIIGDWIYYNDFGGMFITRRIHKDGTGWEIIRQY